MIKQDSIKTAEQVQSEVDKIITKAAKSEANNNLTVEVGGMIFQANELSRQRMNDAITAANELGLTETTWILADNSRPTVSLAELKEAHAKAVLAFGQVMLS